MIRTAASLATCGALAIAGCAAPSATQAAPAATSAAATRTAVVATTPSPSAAATTAAVATARSAAAPSGRLAIGDSVMLGSKGLLRRQGFRVDARVSRQFGSALSLVRSRAAAGSLPRNVVIHLGTNGTITGKVCRAIVRAAGPSRRVFLVNVRVPRPWQTSNNRTLRRCDSAFPASRVQLVDWYRYSAGHPTWVGGDRIHPSVRGRGYYTGLIAGAVSTQGL